MRLFDLHCDTLLCVHNQQLPLSSNPFHVDIEKTAPYESYVQIGAVWSEKRLGNDTAWEHFLRVSDGTAKTLRQTPHTVQAINAAGIRDAVLNGTRAFILAVEDARILNGYLSRVDVLYERGVRFLTLLWSGRTCIGGSHNTDAPLTEFGRAVVRRCFERGIIPDVSHASRAVTDEVLKMGREAGKPVIASHSNSFSVYEHTRNLTDDEFRTIAELGGIVGLSMVPPHLTDCQNGCCTLKTLASHIYRRGSKTSLIYRNWQNISAPTE